MNAIALMLSAMFLLIFSVQAAAEISGYVIDEETKQGVPGAFVYVKRIADEIRSLFPDGGGENQCVGHGVVITDENGKFEIGSVGLFESQIYLNNRYALYVYKRGYEYSRPVEINGKIRYMDYAYINNGNKKNIVLKVSRNIVVSRCDRFCYIDGIDSALCGYYDESIIGFVEQLFDEASEYGKQDKYRIRYMDLCQLRARSMQMRGVDYTILYKYGCEEYIKNSRVIRSWK